LADLGFSKDDQKPRRLSWVTMPDEPPFYRWQARLTFAPEEEVDSPPEIWSEPRVSSSADLDLFPGILAPRRQTILKLGSGQTDAVRAAEAQLVARDAQGQPIAERRLIVDSTRPESRWSVRRGEQQRVLLEAALLYRYDEGRSLSRPPQALLDRELFANDPLMKTVTLVPLVAGAPADVVEIVLIARYEDRASGYETQLTRRLRPPDFRTEDIKVRVLGARDLVSWEAFAVRGNGQTVSLGRGESPGGVLSLLFSSTRRIRVEWLGPTPADLGLRFLRATFRARRDDGQIAESMTLEWRGTAVNDEKLVTLPSEGRAEFSIEKRFEDGRKESSPFQAVDSDLITISG
jgi:hypothetical protein